MKTMKKIFAILTATIVFGVAQAQSSQMYQADTLCQSNRFDEAATIYEAILSAGLESTSLYYNLGYAYYKQGMLGRAALNFERAKRLSPSDPDIAFNLEQVYNSTDKVDVIEPLFFVVWWQSVCDTLSSDGWAVLFLVLFALTLAGIGLFLFSDVVALRKTGFYSAIVMIVCAAMSLMISLDKRAEIIDSKAAIIMSPSATLSTSPDKYGSEMAVLHEGTYVTVVSQLGEWCQVMLKDGNIGWIKLTDIEII